MRRLRRPRRDGLLLMPRLLQRLYAFYLGMREFRSDFTTHYADWILAEDYDAGRDTMHALTLRRYEQGGWK